MTNIDDVRGRMFIHSKTGNIYFGVAVGVHTETQEEFVVYFRDGNPDQVWVRPLSMFFEEVEIDGKKVPRFQYANGLGEVSNGEGDRA